MSITFRVASFATLTSLAGFLFGTTTPGFAQDFHPAPVAAINALTLPQVPFAEPVPPQAAQRNAIVEDAIMAEAEKTPTPEADDPAYTSLADAVAAQDAAVQDRELRCLASGVFHESKGEPLAGQLAVAHTILNRTKSGRFPKSVCSVLTQRGQFSFVRGGHVPSAEGRAGWTTAVAVAKVAYGDLWDGVVDQALYFHARRVAPGWRMTKIAAIGNHVFYR